MRLPLVADALEMDSPVTVGLVSSAKLDADTPLPKVVRAGVAVRVDAGLPNVTASVAPGRFPAVSVAGLEASVVRV